MKQTTFTSSADEAQVIGTMVLAEVFLACLGRPEDSIPFYVYVDECHRLLTADIAKFINEGRKHRASVVCVHQTLGQLRLAGDAVESAVKAARTKIIFNVEDADAAELAPPLFRATAAAALPTQAKPNRRAGRSPRATPNRSRTRFPNPTQCPKVRRNRPATPTVGAVLHLQVTVKRVTPTTSCAVRRTQTAAPRPRAAPTPTAIPARPEGLAVAEPLTRPVTRTPAGLRRQRASRRPKGPPSVRTGRTERAERTR